MGIKRPIDSGLLCLFVGRTLDIPVDANSSTNHLVGCAACFSAVGVKFGIHVLAHIMGRFKRYVKHSTRDIPKLKVENKHESAAVRALLHH